MNDHPTFRRLRWTAASMILLVLPAQTSSAQTTSHADLHLRSRIFIYDLKDGSSHLVYMADSIWEAPTWSPDGKYLIANSGGAIYKLVLQQDGTAIPERLAIPAAYQCNNDKGISPDGKKLAFSATLPPNKSSQVFIAKSDGNNIQKMTSDSPSYFHGWSPDGKTIAYVAQRNGSGQFDVYSMSAGSMSAAGGPEKIAEKRLTTNPHHDDGPDYSPDGRWIYINSDRSGKEALWRLPAEGAGTNDANATMVLSDALEDWFPHVSPDGKKLLYIGYPAGTPTHGPRNVPIEIKIANLDQGGVATSPHTLVEAIGGQGTLNVNSWAPGSARFAYVTYEALP